MLSQLSTKKPVAAVKGAAPKKFYGKNGAIFLPPTIGREEQAGAQVLCTILQGAATVAGNGRPTQPGGFVGRNGGCTADLHSTQAGEKEGADLAADQGGKVLGQLGGLLWQLAGEGGF